MLVFDNDYFKPEIRDGFFIDSTMKSVWAAILETLARVSEVCAKYNIQWYCAYGSLLGAIRHEGFIPWDDDFDIWVLRKDYNKMMEVLPKELPSEYRILSPLTDFGYDMFHSCINNGRTVTFNPERLREYHGCPFTVAIDVFPLDYLPRNENDQKTQLKLFSLISDAASMANGLTSNTLSDSEIRERFSELILVKNTLKDICGYHFNETAFNNIDLKAIISDFWKCANCVAMMFDNASSDYLVEYYDYKRFGSKFEKEYFSETYSATFENVMLPIPSGYDELLHKIYGDYMTPVKGSSTHEYPFYAKQLREARDTVKKLENQKPKYDNIYPSNWEEMIEGKKVVLFEEGIPIYTEYGEKALDKLSDTLKIFKENSNEAIVWWRPQSQIKTALGLISSTLLEKYNHIVDEFIESKYGIYDLEIDDEIALQKCNAYYGEKNCVVNILKGKVPIMIQSII